MNLESKIRKDWERGAVTKTHHMHSATNCNCSGALRHRQRACILLVVCYVPCTLDFDLLAKQSHVAQICSLMVFTPKSM